VAQSVNGERCAPTGDTYRSVAISSDCRPPQAAHKRKQSRRFVFISDWNLSFARPHGLDATRVGAMLFHPTHPDAMLPNGSRQVKGKVSSLGWVSPDLSGKQHPRGRCLDGSEDRGKQTAGYDHSQQREPGVHSSALVRGIVFLT